jgi:hypothetical protein
MFCLVLATLKASCDGKGYNSMTDFYSTLVDRALNRIYGEELGPEQPKDTTIGGLGGRPMSELEGTTTAADAAEPEMPVATDAVLNAVNKMKDYTTKPLANITYVPLKAASKEAALRRNTMLDLLLAGEEEGALPDGFAKMYDYGEVEFSALEYLDRLKSDYDRKTKATIDVPMQDKRVMDTVDPQFPMPTTTREPQYVSLEDAPDADIVLDEPVEITEEGLMDDPISKRPKARPEVETGDTTDFNFKDTSIKLVSDLMKDFDLTKTQAAALVGNLAWESDNYQGMQEYEPAVKGSRGGYGFAQWTGTRRKMFEEWSKENELDPNSYEANYGFLKFELSSPNNEIGNMGVNTIKKLKGTKDLDTATSVVMNEYLRPGIPHEEKRKKRSSQVLDLI